MDLKVKYSAGKLFADETGRSRIRYENSTKWDCKYTIIY